MATTANPVETATPVVVKDKVDTIYTLDQLKTAEFGDGSGFFSGAWHEKTGIAVQLAAVAGATQPWHVGQLQADSAVTTIAKADIAVRRLCTNDKGAPDWAGNTFAYTSAFNAYFVKACKDANIGADEVKRLRGKVREARSYLQMTPAAIAMDIVKADKAFGDKPIKVKGKDVTIKALVTAAEKGDALADQADIPAELKKRMDAVYATQTNKAGTKRLNGFEAPPTKFGKKTRQPKIVNPTDQANQAIESAGAIFAGDKINATQKAIELSYFWTDMLDAFVGKPSEAEKPEPDILDEDAVIAHLIELHNSIGLFLEYKTNPETNLTRKDIVALGKRRNSES